MLCRMHAGDLNPVPLCLTGDASSACRCAAAAFFGFAGRKGKKKSAGGQIADI